MIVCNVDRFLAESIESILGQTFRDFEFIIVDFGSTDKSLSIILSYAVKDSRIRLHQIPHCSLPEARNAGCFLAQGRYIAIADADDVSLPDRLHVQVEFMEEHPGVGVVGGAVEFTDATGRPLFTHRHPLGDPEIREALMTHSVLWQPTAFIRRDAFGFVGGYRALFIQTEDYDLWLRISEHFQIVNLEEVVVKYRFHPHQVSMRKRTQQSLCILAAQLGAAARRNGVPDPLNSVHEITSESLAVLGVTKAEQQRQLASDRKDWIRHMCMAGEYPAALKTAQEALKFDLEYLEPWEIANLHLTVARLNWSQSRPLASALSVARAVLAHPVMVGRPLKPLLRRLSLVGPD